MEILSVCPYVITSAFPRIIPESCHTPHIMHHRKEYDISNDNDTHRDYDNDKDKMLIRPITCYIFKKQGAQGYQIWHLQWQRQWRRRRQRQRQKCWKDSTYAIFSNIARIAKLPYWQGRPLLKVSLYCQSVIVQVFCFVCIVKIVKFGKKIEIWSKLWNFVKIVIFCQNCDIWSKLLSLVKIVKYGQNCEI